MFTYKVDNEIELKLLEQRDAEELFLAVDRHREYLREWLPWVDATKDAVGYQPIIDMWLKKFAEGNGFEVGILYNGAIVGMVGYHDINRNNRSTEIGYWLAADKQGKGIMSRSVKALVDYGFNILNLHRIQIRCATENKKSRAVPERLGFTHEGTIRHAEWLYDHFVDLELYGILNPNE